MNIIVTNKYKDLIYSSNIEILKELNGVFSVSEIANSFNSIFYKKIIIDATALKDFPRSEMLKKLPSFFDMDKLILFIPPDNPPPAAFLSFLVSINLYNFTDNVQGLVELVRKSNSYDDVKNFVTMKEENLPDTNVSEDDLNFNPINTGSLILGIKNVSGDSYATEFIYMLKKTLEENYHKRVLAVEVDKRKFMYYRGNDLYSISKNKLTEFLQLNSNSDLILVDLENVDSSICNDVLYLVNPSTYSINNIMYTDRDAFIKLKGEKIVLVNSLLTEHDVNRFAKEAGISIYFNLPPLNDRIHNEILDQLLIKLGIVDDSNMNRTTKKGLFDVFK